jgi:chaperone modulatory protein CbpM
MISKPKTIHIAGTVLDEFTIVTIDDLCRTCSVDQATVVCLVDEGIAEPNSREESPWRFTGPALPLIARAIRLQRDLGLNPAGVAFAIELLNEIEQLRNRLKHFETRPAEPN